MASFTKITKSDKTGLFTHTIAIATDPVQTPIGMVPGQTKWVYVSLIEEGKLGTIKDFDLSIYETRESEFENRTTGEKMTSTWIVGLK